MGYSRKGVAEKDSTIATVRIGYAPMVTHATSATAGGMYVNGKMAAGNWRCMDMTMLDITGIDATEGDDVTVFGEALPVTQLANWSGTIAYEILNGHIATGKTGVLRGVVFL